MPADIISSIFIVSIIQSIFGVGILLFGTPILLFLGYDYSTTLLMLLPISIAVNLLQISKDYSYIDKKFYKNVLFLSIPFVIFFLIIGLAANININLLVGFILIITALKYFFSNKTNIFKFDNKREKISLIIMGIIHGLTNLGGSLLTAIVFNKKYEKKKTRVTIASCYLTFAIFQIMTLFFLQNGIFFSFFNLIIILIGVVTFIITEKIFFLKINSKKYEKIFSVFLLISGFALIIG